jgi:hypothetical protein
MNNLLTILLTALCLTTQANSKIEDAIQYAAFIGVPVFVACHYTHGQKQRTDNALYIATGVDPGMAKGLQLDSKSRLYYHYNRLEPFVYFETFPKNRYKAFGFGCNYQLYDHACSIFAGPEISYVQNYNPTKLQEAFNYGASAELRYQTRTRWSVGWQFHWTVRNDISKLARYSNYIYLNFKI